MTTTKSRIGLHVLLSALLLGAAADVLLRVEAWGIGLMLWVLQLGAALVILLRRRDHGPSAEQRWLLGAALLCAASWAWRDAEPLNAFSLLGLLVALALLAWTAVRRTVSVRVAEVWSYLGAGIEAGLNALVGAVPLMLSDVDLRSAVRGTYATRLVAIARGVLIAVPLLIVFGSLLHAADARFAALADSVLRVDMDVVIGHLAMTAFFTWITAGYLRGALIAADPILPSVAAVGRLRLGGIEIGIALGLVNLLFLVFVGVQLGYLFGGAEHVLNTAGLTVAEYARRGFFELTAVSGLVLPVLLIAHALVRDGTPSQRRLYTAMAATMIGLVGAIMASAVARMVLYTSTFGLTELRVYSMTCIAWLAVVFAWFAATVLRGRPYRFAFGALASAYVALGALHVVNPDALIVRVNTVRAAEGRPFDASYVTQLSADAVPAVIDALPSLSPAARDSVLVMLGRTDKRLTKVRDWRSANWGRARARAALERVPTP